MQKFVVKKISRSTNILLTSECEQSLSSNCDGEKSQKYDADGHQFQVSSVRMCGYLKKKRNVSTRLFLVSVALAATNNGA